MSEAFNFIKKETLTQVFSCKLCETFNVTHVVNIKLAFTKMIF